MALPLDQYTISTDRSKLDVDLIHRFLSEEAYWAKGRSREQVERSIENSVCYGAYAGGEQVGFARAVTDKATFAWLADVFVVPEHRGRGVGQRLVEAALADPELADVYRWFLGTADAHDLYRRYGFDELQRVERFMARESAENAGRCAEG
jgi:N-acetylglutamate synthase-like GNAT family acetyltransferase